MTAATSGGFGKSRAPVNQNFHIWYTLNITGSRWRHEIARQDDCLPTFYNFVTGASVEQQVSSLSDQSINPVILNITLSTSPKTTTWRQSVSYQRPILADPLILGKNSSREMADSVPEHLGTRDTKETSLWTVGGVVDKRSLKRWISTCALLNSSFKRASVFIVTR